MKRLHLAIVGFGKLGRACADTIRMDSQADLAGVVRCNPATPLPAGFSEIPAVAHISELTLCLYRT